MNVSNQMLNFKKYLTPLIGVLKEYISTIILRLAQIIKINEIIKINYIKTFI